LSQAEFAVGIDLGTTNSVLSFVRLDAVAAELAAVEVLPIPQLVTPGTIESRFQLPSFLYQAHSDEIRSEDVALPWPSENRSLAGEIARHLGSKTPIRLVGSAKSWLSHAQVDRKAPILPVQSPPEVTRISPLDASTAYLRHLKSAWELEFPEAPLADQDLVITVPASFDPGARELTVEAARRVGLGHAVLLEEPQSAVYSWIQTSDGDWRNQVHPGETILVVDVGGGTTDFSLIAVSETEVACRLSAWPSAITSFWVGIIWIWLWPMGSEPSLNGRGNGSNPGKCSASPMGLVMPRKSCSVTLP